MKNYHSVTGFFLPRRNLPESARLLSPSAGKFSRKTRKTVAPAGETCYTIKAELRLNLRISKPNTQRYRSGHNGTDSKSSAAQAFSSIRFPLFSRVFAGSKN